MATLIDSQQVRKIAKLARLRLDEPELNRFQGQLAKILDYIAQLNQVNVDGLEPLAHPLPVTNVVRADEPAASFDAETALAAAPQRQNDYFKVPAVLDPNAGA